MCYTDSKDHVSLIRCLHGNYHLTIGHVSLHLSEDELSLIGRSIMAMADRHRSLLSMLQAEVLEGTIEPGGAT